MAVVTSVKGYSSSRANMASTALAKSLDGAMRILWLVFNKGWALKVTFSLLSRLSWVPTWVCGLAGIGSIPSWLLQDSSYVLPDDAAWSTVWRYLTSQSWGYSFILIVVEVLEVSRDGSGSEFGDFEGEVIHFPFLEMPAVGFGILGRESIFLFFLMVGFWHDGVRGWGEVDHHLPKTPEFVPY